MKNSSQELRVQTARRVLQTEARALDALADRLDNAFSNAIELIFTCRGRVGVTGIGKSGHIGRKIAATFSSTGTPAFFVHPTEAAHGDLGMIMAQDVLLALSNSGESAEILALWPALKRKGVGLIAMTGHATSTMATLADIHLNAYVEQEACPLGLAPTSSTTVQLAFGDALAVTLMQERQFRAEDFAFSHPAGSLGRRLLTRVSDVMHRDAKLPRVLQGVSLKEALLEMSSKGLGMTAVVAESGRLVGVFTDGDLRRLLDTRSDIADIVIDDVMTVTPHIIYANRLAVEAVRMMETLKILSLLVVDEIGQCVGALNMHDLFRAGVV